MNTLFKILSSVYCMLAATASFSQITFHKTYGGLGGETCTSIEKIGGGYVLAGTTGSFGAGKAFLMVIDTAGGIEWAKTYGVGMEGAGLVQQTFDMGFIFTGFTDSTGNGLPDIYVIKTDSIGDTLWTRQYGAANIEWGLSIRQTSDFGYIIGSTTESFGQGQNDIYLVKIDSNGNLQWTKTFGGPSWDYGGDVKQIIDNGYVVAGTTYNYGAGNGDFYLIKTDVSGNAVWIKTFGTADNEGGTNYQETDDGFIVAGWTDIGGEVSPVLFEIDSLGNIIWQKRYFIGQNAKNGFVKPTSDGGYILTAGTGWDFMQDENTYLIKTDSIGDVVWAKMYPGATPGNIQQTDDGGYIVVRYVMQAFTYEESVISVLKIDSVGNVAGCNFYPTNITVSNLSLVTGTGGIAGTGGVMNNTATTIGNAPFVVKDTCFVLGLVEPNSNNLKDLIITVYPNPASGYFYIQGNYALPAVLELYDLTGRKVYRQPVNSNRQQVDVSQLSGGLYVYRLVSEGKVARGKVVIE